jgi:hypothetical protein
MAMKDHPHATVHIVSTGKIHVVVGKEAADELADKLKADGHNEVSIFSMVLTTDAENHPIARITYLEKSNERYERRSRA